MSQPPLLDQRFHLLERIGAGGEAQVFRAWDKFKDQEVAIRLGLQSAIFPEGPIPAGPYPAGWTTPLDTGVDPVEGAYFVLELIRGKTLTDKVGEGPLHYAEWIHFVNESLAAVTALHERQWVHGDLHAENFLFDETASHWKLLELPFLRFQPPVKRSALFGSIYTLAPEQIDGGPATFASDFYSLGCLYYYAVSGHYPHEGETEADIAIARLRTEPAPPDDLTHDFPAAAIKGIMQLLARGPEEREEGRRMLTELPSCLENVSGPSTSSG